MRKVLILGPDRVMPKLFYFSEDFRNHGISYLVYTHDRTPQAVNYAAGYGAQILYAPPHKRSVVRLIRNWLRLFSKVSSKDIVHAELYSDYHMVASLGYFLIMRLKGIPVVLWCRGELSLWSSFAWWQRLYFHIVIPNAHLVVLKETYMRKTLESARVRTRDNLLALHNTVPLPSYSPKPFSSAKLSLLFLNMFKPWRHVMFCVDIAAELKRRGFDFSMKIVGEKEIQDGSRELVEEAQRLRAAIARHQLEGYVTVLPFSDTPVKYYHEADVFLLPADLIYCNYALLESMSHGVIPIVNEADTDYREILEIGISGYAFPLKSEEWADQIVLLSQNRDTARTVSRNARRRIEEEFSTSGAFGKYWAALNLRPHDEARILKSLPENVV